jgi:hypothetical protein
MSEEPPLILSPKPLRVEVPMLIVAKGQRLNFSRANVLLSRHIKNIKSFDNQNTQTCEKGALSQTQYRLWIVDTPMRFTLTLYLNVYF